MAGMENSTSGIIYEYYYDYLDPVIVDERKLKYYKCKLFILTLNIIVLSYFYYTKITHFLFSFQIPLL